MEQYLEEELSKAGVELSKDKIEILTAYAFYILEENAKYNLTGLKDIKDVLLTLIVMSLKPLARLDVPRGTRFADIGTGSGIPGVVVAIARPEFLGTLFDANSKKTDFIQTVADKFTLNNIRVINGRIEDIGHDKKLRGSFDICFSRAFGPLYYSIEFGLPLLKKGGKLYVYSTIDPDAISAKMKTHISILGGLLSDKEEMDRCGFSKEGVLVEKEKQTPDCFPRKFPVVKRESTKIES